MYTYLDLYLLAPQIFWHYMWTRTYLLALHVSLLMYYVLQIVYYAPYNCMQNWQYVR